MKRVLTYLVLLNLVVLVGCSTATAPVQTSKTPTISSPATELPTPKPLASSTAQADSAVHCVGSQQNVPISLDGEFVLNGSFDLGSSQLVPHKDQAYIWIPRRTEKIDLPKQGGSDFLVSPDKKWLAYYIPQGQSLKGLLVIVGSDGKLFKQYPTNNWWGILGWIDSKRLLVSKFAQRNPYPTIVFNVLTGKTERELSPNYPDIFTGLSRQLSTWDNYQLSETIYNSDLSMVVYPKNPSKIVLYDKKAKKEIVEITDLTGSSNTPLWLSNGEEFIIDVTAVNSNDHWNQDELIMIGADGQKTQLTHLVPLYTDVDIQKFSESADGQYIAFWLIIGSAPSRLAIYDTTTKTVTIFCVNAGGSNVAPIWSPSGHQLLVEGTFDTIDNYGAIFVDVDKGVIAQVKKGVIPVGWMLGQ